MEALIKDMPGGEIKLPEVMETETVVLGTTLKKPEEEIEKVDPELMETETVVLGTTLKKPEEEKVDPELMETETVVLGTTLKKPEEELEKVDPELKETEKTEHQKKKRNPETVKTVEEFDVMLREVEKKTTILRRSFTFLMKNSQPDPELAIKESIIKDLQLKLDKITKAINS